MITQHGPMCDVCGDYILLDKSINPFNCKGIKQTLLAHDKCKPKVEAATKWEQLPEGPLRRVFEGEGKVKPIRKPSDSKAANPEQQ